MISPHGYTPDEWAQFTKTERRILHYMHTMHFEDGDIMAALEIAPQTLRGHLANIRYKNSRFRAKHAAESMRADIERAKSKYLPDFDAAEFEQPILPPNESTRFTTIDRGTKKIVARVSKNNLPLKQFIQPLAASAGPPRRPPSIYETIPNPTSKRK